MCRETPARGVPAVRKQLYFSELYFSEVLTIM